MRASGPGVCSLPPWRRVLQPPVLPPPSFGSPSACPPSVGTSPGRSWTTSSGPLASRRRSASSGYCLSCTATPAARCQCGCPLSRASLRAPYFEARTTNSLPTQPPMDPRAPADRPQKQPEADTQGLRPLVCRPHAPERHSGRRCRRFRSLLKTARPHCRSDLAPVVTLTRHQATCALHGPFQQRFLHVPKVTPGQCHRSAPSMVVCSHGRSPALCWDIKPAQGATQPPPSPPSCLSLAWRKLLATNDSSMGPEKGCGGSGGHHQSIRTANRRRLRIKSASPGHSCRVHSALLPCALPYSCPSHSSVSSKFAVVFTAKCMPFASNLHFSSQNTGKGVKSELKGGQVTEIYE